MKKYYSAEIKMPKDAQEGISNFVQMIINDLENDDPQEALYKAVDLLNDIQSKIYKIEMHSRDAIIARPFEIEPDTTLYQRTVPANEISLNEYYKDTRYN